MRAYANGIALDSRDSAILYTLTHKVRILSIPQIARTWWPQSHERAAKRRLSELERAGLITCYTGVCHPELPVSEPVLRWSPGEPQPDLGQASYRLKSRWQHFPVLMTCISATKSAGHFMGGYGGRTSRESEQTHDIHLASVYLHFLRNRPKAAEHWVSEEEVRRSRQRRSEKVPDARVDAPGNGWIVEFGGAYSKEKLTHFHSYCSYKASAYEVW